MKVLDQINDKLNNVEQRITKLENSDAGVFVFLLFHVI
jgi:hypothetical protein